MDGGEEPRARVRLIDPALDDLRHLLSKDPQIARDVLKKMLLLEQSPLAGEPLLGELAGFRKLRAGNRHWRIVWRVTEDDLGATEIEIAKVWAAGARADGEVYDEMRRRLAALDDPATVRPLAEVVEMLGRHVQRDDIQPTPEPPPDPVPAWLAERLIKTAGLELAEVEGLTGAQAMERWEALLRGEH